MGNTRTISAVPFAIAGAFVAVLVLCIVAWILKDNRSDNAVVQHSSAVPSSEGDPIIPVPQPEIERPAEPPKLLPRPASEPASPGGIGASSQPGGRSSPGGGSAIGGSNGDGGKHPSGGSGGRPGASGGKSSGVNPDDSSDGNGSGSEGDSGHREQLPGGPERSQGDNVVYDDHWIQGTTGQKRRIELGNRAIEELRAYIISKLGKESTPSSVNDGESSARATSKDFSSFEVVVTYRNSKKSSREPCTATVRRSSTGQWSVEGDPI